MSGCDDLIQIGLKLLKALVRNCRHTEEKFENRLLEPTILSIVSSHSRAHATRWMQSREASTYPKR